MSSRRLRSNCLRQFPFEDQIVKLSNDEREVWYDLWARRVAFLLQAAARAEKEESTDEQIVACHENVWHLMRHVVPHEDLSHNTMNLIHGEGH